jgi:hypothetical protein
LTLFFDHIFQDIYIIICLGGRVSDDNNNNNCNNNNDNNNSISFIENQMTNIADMDVEGFKRRNLLHILQISDPMHSEEGVLKGVDDVMSTTLADSKKPFRSVKVTS